MTLRVEAVESLEGVTPGAWNRLVKGEAFASYEFLCFMEEASQVSVSQNYFLLWREQALVGGAVGYSIERKDQLPDVDGIFFGRLKKVFRAIGLSFLPTFLCYPRRTYGTHLLISPQFSKEERQEMFEVLLDHVETEALKKKQALAFTKVLEKEVELIALLKKKRYLSSYDLPLTFMPIQWDSFETYRDYLKKINKKWRSVIAHEWNRSHAAGITIEELKDNKEHEEQACRLIRKNHEAYESEPFPFKEGFVSLLQKCLKEKVVVFLAFKEGEVVGASVMVRQGEVGAVNFVGIDHEKTGNDFVYFNLAYYYPAKEASRLGVKGLFFGSAPYDLKMKRGCRMRRVSFFYKPRSFGMRLFATTWFAFHQRWMKRKYVGFFERDAAIGEIINSWEKV